MVRTKSLVAALASGVILPLALSFGVADGQSTEPVPHYHGARLVQLEVALDTIGVYPQDTATPEDIDDALAGSGTVVVRALPGRLLLLGLASPLPRSDLFDSAQSLAANFPALLRAAGIVVLNADPDLYRIVTDQFVVRFREDVTIGQIDSMNSANGATIVARTPFIPNHFLMRTDPTSTRGTLEMANLYHLSVLTTYAHPNFYGGLVSGSYVPSDTHFDKQWHLLNSSSPGGDINVATAWDITKGSESIVIAVIETDGYDVAHPDLAPQLWVNPDDVVGGGDDDDNKYPDDVNGWNFTSCTDAGGLVWPLTTGCGSPGLLGPAEYRDHGTAVAALAAGAEGNGGVVGVCLLCKLMLLKIGPTGYAAARAFTYARFMGASVINNSWSRLDPEQDLVDAVNGAAEYGRSGDGAVITFNIRNRRLFTNGNSAPDVQRCTDGGDPELYNITDVIVVGASNDLDARGITSSKGECLDVLAPGAVGSMSWGITTADALDTFGYNSMHPESTMCPRVELTDVAYTNCFGGTSAAAPLVAGIAGLILSVNPCLTSAQVRTIIEETAFKIPAPGGYDANGFSETHGFGRVDAHAAVTAAGTCQLGEVELDEFSATVELGTRFGTTILYNGSSQAVFNAPGSGPLSRPVLSVTWTPVSWSSLELQLGGAVVSPGGGQPVEIDAVAALQPALLYPGGDYQLYIGLNGAIHFVETGGLGSSDYALGGAVGFRFLPVPFFALRLEARYRHWFDQLIDEFGVALGFGVVLN